VIWPLFGITAIVAVLTVLLLNLNLKTRWPWPLKAVSIAVAFAAIAGGYFAVKGLLGWPVRTSTPESLRVLAIDIVEPDKTKRLPGAIYVWAKAADSERRPRAYAFAYSKSLHQAVAQAHNRMRAGHRQGMRFGTPEVAGSDRSRPQPALKFYDLKRQLEDKTG